MTRDTNPPTGISDFNFIFAQDQTSASLVLQHANKAIDEVRRAEFFPQGWAHAGCCEGQVLAAVDALDE